MNSLVKLVLLSAIGIFPLFARSQAGKQTGPNILVGGMILSADSLEPLPGATISIKGQSRSTISNEAGLFRIMAYPGEIVQFRFTGYKMQEILVPDKADDNTVSLIRKMVPDVQSLPKATVTLRPTQAQFERDFVNTKVNEDQLELIRKNLDPALLKELSKTLRHDAGESKSGALRNQASKISTTGQAPIMKIGDVPSWMKFIRALRHGDFKENK